ncbi:MAG TPA: lycopene beta-cyclase CrtY [Wenzhouxiangellaceae bacterium]|nr:lycopene beta-cyclase CrtY [Wenzhouxiangellaceae bacterium]
MSSDSPDLLLAGGGLANCLVALRVAERQPESRIAIVEAGPAVGGNHTWSFHDGDLAPAQHAFLEPLVKHAWSRQQVRFPRLLRELQAGYFSITSDALRRHVADQPGIEIHTDTPVIAIGPEFVKTATGHGLSATAVLDGRGPESADGMVLGFQKFLGREIRTLAPHGVACPVIMDATVSQADGYRFIYLLPFDETTLLIEDTRYSDGAELSDDELTSAIDDYAADHGWDIEQTLRTERGVLPILMAGDFDRFWPAADPVARAGLRAGLFHPTTGYSLPQAMALADAVAANWPMDGPTLAAFTRRFSEKFWAQTRFFRLLNRMLFRAGHPDQRYKVLERFYGLSEDIITNFYAAELTLAQKARILIGKPPVPVTEAIPLVREDSFMRRETK